MIIKMIACKSLSARRLETTEPSSFNAMNSVLFIPPPKTDVRCASCVPMTLSCGDVNACLATRPRLSDSSRFSRARAKSFSLPSITAFLLSASDSSSKEFATTTLVNFSSASTDSCSSISDFLCAMLISMPESPSSPPSMPRRSFAATKSAASADSRLARAISRSASRASATADTGASARISIGISCCSSAMPRLASCAFIFS